MIKVHYHDGTVEEYPPDAEAEFERFGSTGLTTSTRDGVLSIEYGMVRTGEHSFRYEHHDLIPLVSIRRIEQR